MRKFSPSALLVSLLFVFFNCAPVQAQEMEVVPEQEQINSFDIHITMSQKDFNVEEKIEYDFGQNVRHGIYRYIPVIYSNGLFKRGIKLSNLSVLQDGKAQLYSSSISDGTYNIKIGDPNHTITGVHSYIISYRVLGAYNFLSDHDELYWNSTGNGWNVPISKTSTRVDLPKPLSESSVLSACYQGFSGSETKCKDASFVKNSDGQVTSVTFESSLFDANEGQTVVIGVPKGILSLSAFDRAYLFVYANGYLIGNFALPLAVFFIMLALWWTKGRDPKGNATIIPEYEAPAGLTPIQVGALKDFDVGNSDIAAEIIYLAEKGYLTINRLEDDSDFELTKTGKDYASLPEYQRNLIDLYFPNNSKTSKLKSLKSTIKKSSFDALDGKVYQTLIDLGYFRTSPLKMRGSYLAVAAIIGFIAFFFINPLTVGMVISAFIIGVIGYFMTARTKEGVLAYQHIEGLELYIKVAEEKRIEFHNAPEKNPQHFEALLPYAMVMGLEKKWAAYFSDVNIPQPDWYRGNMTGFNAVVFSNQLSGFKSSAAAVVLTTQASSGGSGFSGGSSGGGFGGGGGGSW